MNIFYLSDNYEDAAKMHCDSHCSKMIIEYAQLMSTAHRVLDGEEYTALTKNGRKIKRWRLDGELGRNREPYLYKACHVNHPSAIWVRQSLKNYMWLYAMWKELNAEYMYRYSKDAPHASFAKLECMLRQPPREIPRDIDFTQPTQAMPDDVKNESSLTAYRDYYIKYKQHLAKWKLRGAPYWYETEYA